MMGMNVTARLTLITILSGIVTAFATGTTAFAQAGSTGGTLGKQDKSLSGERQEEEPAPPRHTRPVEPAPAKPAEATPKYLGCFRDQLTGNPFALTTQGRDLNGFASNDANMTSAHCIALCRSQGFAYAGVEYSTNCFCGNSYGRSGAADNCNMACGGNPAEMCGGYFANSVYSVSGRSN